MSDLAIAARIEGVIARLPTSANLLRQELGQLVQDIEDDLPRPEILCQACGDPTCQGCYAEQDALPWGDEKGTR